MEKLNPLQQAMTDEAATQCGFCTPGFVVSIAGFCLSKKEASCTNAIAAINGNICRCTGYKSIERAAAKVSLLMRDKKENDPIEFVTKEEILPNYFTIIKERLKTFSLKTNGILVTQNQDVRFLGGGTDLYVQQHEQMVHADINFLVNRSELQRIYQQGSKCFVGASATVTDMLESPIFNNHFQGISRFIKLISSTPIRNIATIAGNFINASPIGDLTIFFLALDAQLILSDNMHTRELPLRELYKGYKKLDKKPEEFIEKIWFELPASNALFNFEKVSKRTHLDIASVNSAMSVTLKNNVIISVALSAGGVGPVPLFLNKTSTYLQGKILVEEIIGHAIEIAQSEILPISDARGSEDYKRLLLAQLIKAHFLTLFPTLKIEKLLN
jgi:xanthine dehydrogenase small subunit